MTKHNERQIKTESSSGMIIALLIVVISLALYYLDPLGLNTVLYKVLALLAGIIVAGVVFLKSPQGTRFMTFLLETKIELRKVVWPKRDETAKTTGMIIIAVVIVAIFLSIVDAFFTWAVQLLTN